MEGRRLIEDAINAGLLPESIYFSSKDTLEYLSLAKGAPLRKVGYRAMKKWSDLSTCPGVMGKFLPYN